jgi:hypothetical protein
LPLLLAISILHAVEPLASVDNSTLKSLRRQ